jgi:hypothetical protein
MVWISAYDSLSKDRLLSSRGSLHRPCFHDLGYDHSLPTAFAPPLRPERLAIDLFTEEYDLAARLKLDSSVSTSSARVS